MYPSNLKYAESHEWARMENDMVTVGITDYAVKELTDLTYLELPRAGEVLLAGDAFGVIESVKATSDLYVPVSGQVIEVNAALPGNLDILSEDPYVKGWMVKLRASNLAAEVSSLLSAEEYRQRVEAKS
ncbi:MAG: glycine cleavage system protein GcvH [Planctomycetes bacterium]|nr:glycine cleavage system protein GcvH [Planctomycetota bacterium]